MLTAFIKHRIFCQELHLQYICFFLWIT